MRQSLEAGVRVVWAQENGRLWFAVEAICRQGDRGRGREAWSWEGHPCGCHLQGSVSGQCISRNPML